METSIRKSTAYIVVGLLGLALSAGYLALSFALPFGRWEQPGAGIFPVIVGFLLVIASLATIWEGWRSDSADEVGLPCGMDRNRVVLLIVLLGFYAAALPWLGEFVANALFIAVLMRSLSSLGWVRVAFYALVMAVCLHLVFMTVLKVPLPSGVLGIDLP